MLDYNNDQNSKLKNSLIDDDLPKMQQVAEDE